MKPESSLLNTLIDILPDEGDIPCSQCPELTIHRGGRIREWEYGTCRTGWLPDTVTTAALEVSTSKFGRSIRKLARLCPHALSRRGLKGYVLIVYLTTNEPEQTLKRRLTLMLQALPFTKTVFSRLRAITG